MPPFAQVIKRYIYPNSNTDKKMHASLTFKCIFLVLRDNFKGTVDIFVTETQ